MPTITVLRTAIAAALAALAALALVAPAQAVVQGRNGRIVFASGREEVTDNTARIFMLNRVLPPSSPESVTPLGGQSRHPSWSPDRTKIVFANGKFTGDPATEEYDLFVRDLVENTIAPLDGTQINDGLSSDHPTWSPDGTRIAYETQTVDNTANREIAVKTVGSAAPAQLITATAQMELKSAWSADSQTLYYARQNGAAGQSNYDIVSQPAAGGAETPVLNATNADEYQPAISADGTKMCFTNQSTPGNTGTAEIMTVALSGGGTPVNVSDDATKGDINCVWSPDGKKIAFTNGVFSQGRLVVVDSDDSSPFPQQIAEDQGSNNFDGNADWATDGSPDCPDTTVTTTRDTPVTIPLECTDTGPAYEQTDPSGTVRDAPANGTLSDFSPAQTNPSTVTYTPTAGFTGVDTVRYSAFDDYGFGTDQGTVTIRVEAPQTGGGGDNGPGGGGAVPDRTAPVVTKVKLRRAALRIARGATVPRRPGVLTFASSEAGRVAVKAQRTGKGRRIAKTLRVAARAGTNRVRLDGRVGRRLLPSGRYRLTITVRDAAGNTSKPVTRRLTVVRGLAR